MDGGSDGLYKELTAVCKGPGARGESVLARMGPQLRRECGVTDRDTHPAARQRLEVWVDRSARRYPAESRMILRTVLGLHPPADHASLVRRKQWLATELHCGLRTVQRRVVEALQQLTHDAVAEGRMRSAAAEYGYVVRFLTAVLRLDRVPHEAIERYTIEATQDSLETILRPLSVPPCSESGNDTHREVVAGGELVGLDRKPGKLDLIEARIAPPWPIARGKTHDFAIRHKFCPEQHIAPHYAVLPFTVYDQARLAVWFSPDRLPAKVWRLDGVTPWQLEHPDTAGELLPLEQSGQYEDSFFEFRAGRAYGLGWAWE